MLRAFSGEEAAKYPIMQRIGPLRTHCVTPKVHTAEIKKFEPRCFL